MCVRESDRASEREGNLEDLSELVGVAVSLKKRGRGRRQHHLIALLVLRLGILGAALAQEEAQPRRNLGEAERRQSVSGPKP